MTKSNEGLKDTAVTEFFVEVLVTRASKAIEWSEIYWGIYTATLQPFTEKRNKGRMAISFPEQGVALEAAKAIKAAYPDERVRVVQRETIIEETFILEVA